MDGGRALFVRWCGAPLANLFLFFLIDVSLRCRFGDGSIDFKKNILTQFAVVLGSRCTVFMCGVFW